MKVAICDDIKNDLYLAESLFRNYCKKAMLEVNIDLYGSSSELMPCVIKGAYDLYILDIYMDTVNGMELARKIRQEDDSCEIIFVTISPDFALDGFGVYAIGYLIKPLTEEKLQNLLNRYSRQFLCSARYITIKHSRNNIRLLRKSIIYAEIYGKQTLIYTSNGVYHTWTSLDELERKLDGEPFLRCHRSYIINMQYVDCVQKADFVLEDGTKIPLSSHEVSQYKKIWQNYVFSEAKEKFYEDI